MPTFWHAGAKPAHKSLCGGDCPLVWRGEQCEKAGRGAACSTCTARKRRIAAAKSPAKLQKKLGQAKRRKRQADLPKHFDGVDAAAATAAVPAVQALAEEATNPAPAEGVASFAVLAPVAAAAVPTLVAATSYAVAPVRVEKATAAVPAVQALADFDLLGQEPLWD